MMGEPIARAARSIPSSQQTFLSFDFGEKRTGVAVGNRLLHSANPLPTVAAVGKESRFVAIEKIVGEWQPDALVVGIPTHPDGAAHEMTLRAQKFARQLQAKFQKPVYEVDERYSSVEAASRGARDLDAGAAVIILEQFFSELPS
jgi:putative holliday junction resolvase